MNGASAATARAGEQRRGELEREREPDQPVKAAPVLARGVAEAVLDECLVARQLEQELEEGRDADDDPEPPCAGGTEHAKDDERAEDAERGGAVDPERGRRTAPEKPGAHLGPRV